MVQVLGVNLKEAAWFSAVPWAMMAAVGFVAGGCSDFLVQHGVTVTTTRKIMQVEYHSTIRINLFLMFSLLPGRLGPGALPLKQVHPLVFGGYFFHAQ